MECLGLVQSGILVACSISASFTEAMSRDSTENCCSPAITGVE